MAHITHFVEVPFKQTQKSLVAEQGIHCPSERSAIAYARGTMGKGAIGAIAFRCSGYHALGRYGEATLICKEGDLSDSVPEMLAA